MDIYQARLYLDWFLERAIPVVIAALFGLFSIYCVFVWLPVGLRNESKCLALGYEDNHTTLLLDGYCLKMVSGNTVVLPLDKQ